MCQVTVETTGTMLLGSEIGAALTALEPLGIDVIGLNCATGPAEMSEHLRHLSRHASIMLSCMPNAGLPMLGRDGAHYPLTPEELADAHDHFTRDFGLASSGAAAARRPSTCARSSSGCSGRGLATRRPRREAGVASLYQHVPFRQDTSYLSIGERTNANGSLGVQEAMLEERWDDCIEIARDQTRDGAHLLDVCIDYVGRDGVADMKARRWAVRHRFDAAAGARLDRAGGHRGRARAARRSLGHQLGQLRGRRRPGLALRPGDAGGQGARRGGRRAVHRRGGSGAHRRVEGPGGHAPHRGPHRHVGHEGRGHRRRHADLPDHHRSGGDAPRRAGDDRGDPPSSSARYPDGPDHAGPVERLVRRQPGRPHRAELGVPPRVREGRAWTRRSCTPPRSCR